MRRLIAEVFPSRTTVLIAALLLATLATAAGRYSGLLPIGTTAALTLYAAAAATGAAAAALAAARRARTNRRK